MKQVKIGTRVNPLGINRVVVADNAKCRAILIDPNPRMKYVAWDDSIKRRVEVDQAMVIKYGLRPMTTFYYLVAKLNTDMNGVVVDDKFVVEYLTLSESVNNDFADAVAENPKFTSLLLTKVIKKGDNGKDFSYVKPTPSTNQEISEEIEAALDKIRNTEGAIEGMWAIVDASTSINRQQYEALKQTAIEQKEPTKEQKQVAYQPKREQKQVENKGEPSSSPMPQNEGGVFNDPDDFNDDKF